MEQSNSTLRFVMRSEAETMEERQAGRCMIAANLAAALEYVVRRGLIQDLEPSDMALEWERFQRGHIEAYMRQPQDPRLSEIERLTGGKLDRLSLKICDVVRAWDHRTKVRHAREYRKMRETQLEAERQKKILQRRRREQEQSAVRRQPKLHIHKRVEHEDGERCMKCNKRRAVSAHLCDPCLKWEKAKLGRE